MKQVSKRFWSLLLSAALVFTTLPTAAFTAEAQAADTALQTELVTNGGAESDAVTGWTDDTGQGRWNSGTAYSTWANPAAGSKYFYLYNPSIDTPLTGSMSQGITLSGTEGSGLFSAISAGKAAARVSVSMYQGIGPDNEVKVMLKEYDAGGALLRTSQTVNTVSSGGSMASYQINTQLNPATRSFRIILSATLTKGGYAQFDQVSLKLEDASAGSAPVFGSDFPASAETDAGVAYTAGFSISDTDPGDVDKLTFSASSTNVNLVSASGIAVGGSGGSRTLTVTPTGNLSGEADITVTASDGTKSAEKTFHLVVHKVIFMDANLVENGNGTSGLASWSGNTVNITATGNGFKAMSPGSSMSQNIDISKFSLLIDGGETTFALSATLPNQTSQSGKISVQFYTNIACTNPVGSPFGTTSFPVPRQKIPSGAKGATITFSDISSVYVDVPVQNISFQIVNDFPKISAVSSKTTLLSALTVPVYAYYTTADARLTASSSDQTIVPDGGISIGGSGFSRSVSLTPLKAGTVTISLTLNDGSKTASASFGVTAHEPASVAHIVAPASGFYGNGENLDFTVEFSAPVIGGVTSTLPLTIGGVPAAASYLSSTNNSITYRYTVAGGDSGAVAASAINDAASPITDQDGFAADLNISAGDIGVTAVPAPQITSTAVGGSATYGTGITFTAALSCATLLSGSVQFEADGVNLGSPIAVNGNSASYETAETELHAGTHSITAEFVPSGSGSHFASLTSSARQVNIGRRAITVTPNPAAKLQGTDDPALSYQITGGTLAASDSLTGSLSRAAGETVGEYAITQGTLTDENNPDYDITFIAGIGLEITAVVSATVTPADGSFDRNISNQADVQASISWGSAASVTDIKAGGISIGSDSYSVSGSTLTLKKNYLASQATGDLILTVVFNRGSSALLTVSISDTTPIPVISIAVSGAGGAGSVAAGGTLQMQASVSPGDAANKRVTWTIASGSGANIDANGLLAATAAGTVTVRATAQDGSGAYGEATVNIVPAGDTVEINIAQSPIKSILHAITFGLFFDDTIDVSIMSANGTADHYEYQAVADGDTFDAGGTWTRGDSFSISPEFKGRVYARAAYGGGTTSGISVKALVVDTTKPEITADYAGNSVEVSVKDNGAGIDTITYRVGSGAERTITLTPSATQDISTQHDFTISNLPDGRYDVVIDATDNSGNAADTRTVSIDRSPAVVGATISPAARNYDFAFPGDEATNITWNSASKVTGVKYRGTDLKDSNYQVSGCILTIKDDYLQTLNLSVGDTAEFAISFDAGVPVTFTVDFTDGYTPSDNTDLSDLTVNGTTVTGFAPNTTNYNVELPYGTATATVAAEADDPHATVDITQAGPLPGTAIVNVTAENTSASKEYKIRFTLADPTPTAHGITVQNDGHGTGSVAPASATAGAVIALTAAPNSGYHFKKWQAVSPTGLAITGNTFTMPDEAVTVKAVFTANSSSGFPGGTTTTPPVSTEKQPNLPVTGVVSVTAAAGEGGSSSAAIPDQSVIDAIAKARADAKAQGKTANGISVALNITAPKGTSALSATLSQAVLKALVDAGVTSLEINGLPVGVSFDQTALRAVQSQSSGKVTITAAARQNLSGNARAMIGIRPVYNITAAYSSNSAVTNLGGGTATVSIPYTPAKGEAAGYLYGVYVDGNGNATRIDGSAYDANSGCLIFSTGHLSIYGVGYNAPSAKFTDISGHWAKDSIDYVVGRGLFAGTSDTAFAPDTVMTRATLATALGKLAGVDAKLYPASSFTDVKSGSDFQPYIEWAYQEGIVQGIGNGQFAPDRAVTREEIAVILQNYAGAAGYPPPVTRAAVTFADGGSIGGTYKDAVKAMQQAGIMLGGNNNVFSPISGATRAEVAAMLTRYIKLTIDPTTAQGWAKNDSGQRMYFKDGKALTGWQTVGGKVYCFDNSGGAFAGGWKQNAKGELFFLSSDGSAVTRWKSIGVNGTVRRYYFDASGVMMSGKWVEIGGKWYYFYADGSLAAGTAIDGYAVDKNGVRKAGVRS